MKDDTIRIAAYIILGTINSLIIIWAIIQGIKFLFFNRENQESKQS